MKPLLNLQKKLLNSTQLGKYFLRFIVILQVLLLEPVYSETIDCKKPYENLKQGYYFDNCKEFQNFYQKYKRFEIGLMYISEFPESATSAFGHVAMIFIDKDDLLNSPTISFLAQTNDDDNFFKYSYKGIFGYYYGVYKEKPLYKLIDSYVYGENRNIYIYKFKDNLVSKDLLISYLYEKESEKIPYFFFSFNCADGLDLVLQSSIEKKAEKNYFITYPHDLIYKFRDQLETYKIFLNSSLRLYLSKKKVSNVFISDIKDKLYKKTKISLAADAYEEQYQNDLFDFISSKGVMFRNAHSIVSNFPLRNNLNLEHQFSEDEHQERISLEFGILKEKNNIFAKFSFRPSFLNKFEQKKTYNNLYTLELFKFDLLSKKPNHLSLDRLQLLNSETLNHYEWPSNLLSSKLIIGYEKNSFVGNKDFSRIKSFYQVGGSVFKDSGNFTFLIGPQVNFFTISNRLKIIDLLTFNYLLKKQHYLFSVENNFSILYKSLDRNTNLSLLLNFSEFDLKLSVFQNWNSSELSFTNLSYIKSF